VCAVLEPIQAIASIIPQSLQLLPSMDLEMVIGLRVKKQQQERFRSIWFALMQSCRVIQQFFGCMALQAPTHVRNEMPKEAQFHVIWDSGASVIVMSHRLDFVGHYSKPLVSIRLKGLAKGLNIAGLGHVMWLIMDTTGMLQSIKVPAYHVPDCNTCLLSVSSLLQTYQAETISLEKGKLTLSGEPGQPTRGPVIAVIALVDPGNNLPASQAYSYNSTNTPVQALQTIRTEVSSANLNLTEPEKNYFNGTTIWDTLDTRRFNI
jgi:hypothetical protein